jgi:hypothetical protein
MCEMRARSDCSSCSGLAAAPSPPTPAASCASRAGPAPVGDSHGAREVSVASLSYERGGV